MKLIEYALDGKVYHLLLNGTALFNCYDRFGRDKSLLDLLTGDDRESHEAAVFMLAEFSLQGELYRRFQGEDRGPVLQAAQAACMLKPVDMPGLRIALAQTIRSAFQREHQSVSFDPYLAEIDQKKNSGTTRPEYLRLLTKILGLTVKEGMMLPPGVVLDLAQLEKNSHSMRKEETDGNEDD